MRTHTILLALFTGVSMVLAGCTKSAEPPSGGSATPSEEAAPAQAAATVSYASQVKPLFEAHCYKCHGGEERIRGGLNLTTEETALKGSEHGVVIVPGDSAGSKLIAAVHGSDPNVDRMPPKGEPLSADQMNLLATWIDEGASFTN